MLNLAQTYYMILKYSEEYPKEDRESSPLIAIESIGYLIAILKATDDKAIKELIKDKIQELRVSSTLQLIGAIGGDTYDKL